MSRKQQTYFPKLDNGHDFTQLGDDDGLSGYIVIIEWDGGTPPTTWYNRLREFGLRVRGDKEVSPIARRVKDAGVISQEGAIVTKAEGTASLLASYAKELGAKSVMTGPISVQAYSMSADDAKALQKVTSQWGRRGPKNKADEGIYTVTCREEARAYPTELRERPVVCPSCGTPHIFWTRGEQRRVEEPPTNLPKSRHFNWWANSRFTDGRFSIPVEVSDGEAVSVATPTDLPDEANGLSGNVLAESFKDVADVMAAYDCLYCLATDADTNARWTRRVKVLTEYYQYGQNMYPLSKKADIDMADLAAMNSRFMRFM